MATSGILNINKPSGKTSFKIVSAIRRLTSEKHVGHIGTLDPLAGGVLPVCIGTATRIIPYIDDTVKMYRAEIEMGTSTDTFDREGSITRKQDPGSVGLDRIQKALASFTGTIEQTPPRYSALKFSGRKYYDLARAGIDFKPASRKVEIREIALISFDLPLLTVTVECGRGTYIRSLASDIGEMLGCGAHLRNLVRLRSGPFTIEESVPFDDAASIIKGGAIDRILLPADYPVLKWEKVILDSDQETAVRRGISISLNISIPAGENYVRAYTGDNKFAALLRYQKDQNLWHPERVFIN